MNDTTSRHLRGASEVVLTPRLRSDFVDIPDGIVSYASRLALLLDALFQLRQAATDHGTSDDAGPIERLQTVYSVQWTVLEDQQLLLVAATFDRSWEDYFRLLFEQTGPLLDAIFCHCADYQDFSDDFDGFCAWVRTTQRPCNFFFAANPELTTDDERYLKQLSHATNAALQSQVQVLAPDELPGKPSPADTRDLVRAVDALYRLRRLFPSGERLSMNGRTAREVFDQAMAGVFYSVRSALKRLAGSGLLDAPVSAWADQLADSEVARLQALVPSPAEARELDADTLREIQGGILTDYGEMAYGAALLLRCKRASGWTRLLTDLRLQPTTESQAADGGGLRRNIALSYPGLERLGLGDARLHAFPKEFREGMEPRAGLLGDCDDREYPEDTWPKFSEREERIPLQIVDAVITLQVGRDGKAMLSDEIARIAALEEIEVLYVQELFRNYEQRANGLVQTEPFGFVEGSPCVGSQPTPNVVIAGHNIADDVSERDRVALGELLLGHPDRHTDTHRHKRQAFPEIFDNGTFLVMRKLEQRVEQFDAFADEVAKTLGRSTNEAKALICGRNVDGSPLEPAPPAAPNDFDYQSASRCPVSAHVRRSNPRHVGTPRLLRRSFLFEEETKRGTFFMAYNASIAGQFEVIQRWINGGNSTGALSLQRDLLAGQTVQTGVPYYFQAADGSFKAVIAPSQAFVRLHWGMYLFVPSTSARSLLAAIAAADKSRTQTDASSRDITKAERGAHIIERLERSRPHERADDTAYVDGWRAIIEDPSNYQRAADVWTAIRADPKGYRHVPGYGCLVATRTLAKAILSDAGAEYSVREYWRRMQPTMGEHYLAFDPAPRVGQEHTDYAAAVNGRYASESQLPNTFLRSIGYESAYCKAFDAMTELVRKPLVLNDRATVSQQSQRTTVYIEPLATLVIARWAHEYLGLTNQPTPTDAELVMELQKFITLSRYAFQTAPVASLRTAAIDAHADFARLKSLGGELARNCKSLPGDISDRASIGAVVGFAAPAIVSILSVIDLWCAQGDLAATSHWAGNELRDTLRTELRAKLVAALAERPVPPLLYRTAVGSGLCSESANERVLVGLNSVYADGTESEASEAWLFGGSPHGGDASSATTHGCPARDAALGVVAGAVAALLVQRDLKCETRFVLSFSTPSALAAPAH